MPLQIFPDIYADYTLRCYFKKKQKAKFMLVYPSKAKTYTNTIYKTLNAANLLQYLKIIYFNKSYLLDRPILVCT